MIARPNGPGGAGPRIKICGITRPEDAALAAELGAGAIGVVFWAGSPRAVSVARAREIVRRLPADVERVGVFVDADADDVNHVAEEVPLSAVQLHGGEAPQLAARLSRPAIRAVNPSHGRVEEVDARWPEWVLLLVDVHDPARRGGTGRPADWGWAAELAVRRPVILSGGLRADNVAAAVARVRPYGLDVSSGVECAPGIKDHPKLREFFAAVRATAPQGDEGWPAQR
jgi:phosphoribosylanthranilate isomerase